MNIIIAQNLVSATLRSSWLPIFSLFNFARKFEFDLLFVMCNQSTCYFISIHQHSLMWFDGSESSGIIICVDWLLISWSVKFHESFVSLFWLTYLSGNNGFCWRFGIGIYFPSLRLVSSLYFANVIILMKPLNQPTKNV